MKSMTGLVVMLAGLALVPARPAVADGVSGSLLRAHSQAIGSAIVTQVQAFGDPLAVQPGNRMIMAPQGATLYSGPAPGAPVLDRLGPGAPVLVTRPAGANGWAEVLSGGQFGYVWAPQLTPQGFPPPPWRPGH